MTLDQLAKTGSEHGHQAALFAWCKMAERYGVVAADDPQCYAKLSNPTDMPHAMRLYGTVAAVHALRWIHAIGNGGSRGDTAKSRAIRGGQMKAEGVKPGIADIFLPWPRDGWHGLYIEMKKPSEKPKRQTSRGGLSDDQIEYRTHCHTVGYGWCVCYSWQEAVAIIKQYLGYAV